jgi:hypothetical protein
MDAVEALRELRDLLGTLRSSPESGKASLKPLPEQGHREATNILCAAQPTLAKPGAGETSAGQPTGVGPGSGRPAHARRRTRPGRDAKGRSE